MHCGVHCLRLVHMIQCPAIPGQVIGSAGGILSTPLHPFIFVLQSTGKILGHMGFLVAVPQVTTEKRKCHHGQGFSHHR